MPDTTRITTWRVRCYDAENNVRETFLISDRTEYDAVKEAESDPRVLRYNDWSMVEDNPQRVDDPEEEF